MKKICLNCHYLSYKNLGVAPSSFNEETLSSLSGKNRKGINQIIEKYRKNSPTEIICYMGIWKMINNRESLETEILKKKRDNCVYFIKYDENIDVNTMNSVQNKKFENKNIRRSFLLSVIAIIISFLSLIIVFFR